MSSVDLPAFVWILGVDEPAHKDKAQLAVHKAKPGGDRSKFILVKLLGKF